MAVNVGVYWLIGKCESIDFIGTRVSGGSERLRGFSVRPVQDI